MAGLSDAEIKAIICQMTEDRGFIINSFAQIECRLADLIDQCQDLTEYEADRRPIPFSAGNRVARVRELSQSGPLAPHAERLEAILRRFLELEDLRHLFAHGYASVTYTPEGDFHMCLVRYVPPPKGGDVTMVRQFYRPQTMSDQRASSVAFVEGAMAALRDIYQEVGLDPDRLAKYEPAPSV